MTTVSHSEVESWLLCERRHYYGYGLGIQRVMESDSLNRGTLGHAVLENYWGLIKENYTPENAASGTMEFLKHKMDGKNSAIVNEVAGLFGMFIKRVPDLFKGWQILAVEKEFVANFGDDLSYPFVIDAVFRDPFGKIVVVDWKFIYDFITPRHAAVMPQIPKYIGALRHEGFKVDYGLYGMLRTRKLAAANNTPENKIQVLRMDPTEHRVERILQEQEDTAREIVTRKSLPLHVQSRQAKRVSSKMVCNSCSFLSICVAELDGTNPGLVLRTEYKPRERREFVVKSEDEED